LVLKARRVSQTGGNPQVIEDQETFTGEGSKPLTTLQLDKVGAAMTFAGEIPVFNSLADPSFRSAVEYVGDAT
jgi:hypothetical protein